MPINPLSTTGRYDLFVREIGHLLAEARRQTVRSLNAILTMTYWEIGRRIVEYEQGGKARAEYGEHLLLRLAKDLMAEHGRGFSARNLRLMRVFYSGWEIWQTPSAKFEVRVKCPTLSGERLGKKRQTLPAKSTQPVAFLPAKSQMALADLFPLSWSHYVRLMMVEKPQGRAFYETEAVRGGWSIRQLDRQIESQFYERTMLSRNKAAMLVKGSHPQPQDVVLPEEEIKDPYVLEFLNLKDEYSESDLEDGLIRHLETFLLELGNDFTFVARQKRLRIGQEWYRVDLLFYHRLLRCLILIDLKIGRFTHADAGQMHLYLNYAREHWLHPGENPPVGLILCAQKDAAVAHYALEGLPNKVLAAEYLTTLPDERKLEAELKRTQIALNTRRAIGRPSRKKGNQDRTA